MREAATRISAACGAPGLENQTMDELERSADDGTLSVFLNGQTKRYRYRHGQPAWPVTREFLEVYADDLNEWLAANEPHCELRFPVDVNAGGRRETTKARRARWLAMLEKEQGRGGSRGALQRIFEAERVNNQKLDRSYMGKEIKKARRELARDGAALRAHGANDPFGAVIRHLVGDRPVR